VEAADIVQTMIKRSRRATVLADRSKLDTTALVKICDFDVIDHVVTDLAPSEALQTALEEAGVELHIASIAENGL